jgi:hypothetical protein
MQILFLNMNPACIMLRGESNLITRIVKGPGS